MSRPSKGKMRMITVKLAKGAIFEEEVMRRCTPGVTGELPYLTVKAPGSNNTWSQINARGKA